MVCGVMEKVGRFNNLQQQLLLLTAFMLNISMFVHAQVPELSFRYYGKSDGLVSTTILDIAKDADGFIWIGTNKGLDRFDGHSFTNYAGNPKDSLSLPSNYVQKLFVDREGLLWVGTNSGLSTFDSETNSFNRISIVGSVNGLISNEFRDIIEDKEGNIIVLIENKIFQLDKASKKFTCLLTIQKGNGRSILADENGNLWVGTNEMGIIKYNPKSKKTDNYISVPNENSLSHNSVHDLIIWKNKLWVATMGNGINSMDLETEEFKTYKFESPDAVFSFKLYVDNDNNLWSLDFSGLKIFDESKETFHGYYPIPGDRFSIKPAVKGIIQDKQNNYWIFNQPGGLAISTNRLGFKFYNNNSHNIWHTRDSKIISICEDEKGNLWLGNGSSGIDIFIWSEGRTKRHTYQENEKYGLGMGAIQSIYRDRENNMWVSAYHTGLQKYRSKTNDFITYSHNPFDSNSVAGNDIRSITQSRDGNLLLTVHGKGFDVFNPNKQEFTHYNKENSNLSNDWTFDALEDSEGNIWVATSWGLNILEKGSNRFINYLHNQEDSTSISHSQVLCLQEDSKGNIWVGTLNGLNRYNKLNKSFTRYNQKLDNNHICGIHEDAKGNIWVSTLTGITRLDPNSGRVKNYGLKDGLLSEQFFDRSSFQNSKNQIFFGGTDGVEFIKPEQVVDKIVEHKITIRSFKLFNKVVTNQSHPEILSKHISYTREIELSYKQNDISFSYGTLNYISARSDNYYYKLHGFDEEWVNVGNKRDAVYTNLDPGKYTFEVKALDIDHNWSVEPAKIDIIITPPWYGTFAFRLLTVFFIIGGIYLIIRLRISQFKKKQEILSSMVAEKTYQLRNKNDLLREANTQLVIRQKKLEQQSVEIQEQSENIEKANNELTHLNTTKDKLFSIIAHDLLSPFNSILGFSELLVKEYDKFTDKERITNVKILNQSSIKVYSLLQNLLMWARSQTKGIKHYPERISMNSVIDETVRLQREVYLNKNITVQTKVGGQVFVLADMEMIKCTLRNIFSNAIKFSPVNGEIAIVVEVNESKGEVKTTITDEGPGINDKLKDALLNSQPIVPGKGSQGEKGSGLGLAVCQEFVRANKGVLTINNLKGKGSSIAFTLPLES